MVNKVFIHWNLPRDIHRIAAKSEDFESTVFMLSAHLKGLKEGFIANKIEPIFSFRMHYFFNYKWLYSSKYYKYFFYFYNFTFGFLDNFLLYSRILKELNKHNVCIYYTELNPTITNRFLKQLRINNIKSIEWFGLFPNQLNYNTRPNKTLSQFDLIVSGEDYRPFFYTKPNKFLLISQAISLDKIKSIKNFQESDKIDIVFIGSVSKIHSNRWNYLEFLYKNYKNIELYGFGIDQVPEKYNFKSIFKEGLWGDEYFKKMKNSKIIINLFQDDYENLSDGINIRAFEIPACRSLQLCKRLPFLNNYFTEDEDIVLFSDVNELKEKIDFYLKNEIKRNFIISNGFESVKKYDYKNQLKTIIKSVSNKGKSDYMYEN